MRYIGSKTLLLNEIATVVKSCTDNGIFCDPFGGIGTVGNYMKKMGPGIFILKKQIKVSRI